MTELKYKTIKRALCTLEGAGKGDTAIYYKGQGIIVLNKDNRIKIHLAQADDGTTTIRRREYAEEKEA